MNLTSMTLRFCLHNPSPGNTAKHIVAEAPNITGTTGSKTISEEETGTSECHLSSHPDPRM